MLLNSVSKVYQVHIVHWHYVDVSCRQIFVQKNTAAGSAAEFGSQIYVLITTLSCVQLCCIFISSMDPDEVVAGCFEFRLRTRSFDLHQLTHGSKLKKFGRLFRASSDGGVKQTSSVPSSPAGGSSPRHSPPRRRRFVRVVRDKPEDCTEDGRYVVHKYSEEFLARMNRER